jgi:hypothetical protein
MKRNTAYGIVKLQRMVVAERQKRLNALDQDKWCYPLRDQREQELQEAKEQLKVYEDQYQHLASKDLTELYTKRKTLSVRIDSLASYDLDMEEGLMIIDRDIKLIETEAQTLGIALNPILQ